MNAKAQRQKGAIGLLTQAGACILISDISDTLYYISSENATRCGRYISAGSKK
jgi:hypothetical protein